MGAPSHASLLAVDWSALPVPANDGAARHLTGSRVPAVALTATDGGTVELAAQSGRTVVFVYPMTGNPGVALPKDWDAIPGARGCTPHACSFRDLHVQLKDAGADRVFGLSAQNTGDQCEVVGRLHLPFSLLSDAKLDLAIAMRLPIFDVDGHTLLKRMAMIIDDGRVTAVFYPVFPPDRNADDVLQWLKENPR